MSNYSLNSMQDEGIQKLKAEMRKWGRKISCNESDFYYEDNIPAKKLTNAIDAFAKAVSKKTVIGLIDATLFGSSDVGMLFTTTGIYYRLDFSDPVSIKYDDIMNVSVIYCDNDDNDRKLEINLKNKTIIFDSCQYNKTPLYNFIVNAKKLTQNEIGNTLIVRCKNILERDNNRIDNLPLDRDILEILAKTKFLKFEYNDTYDYYTDLSYMEEPNILSYESTFKEYGYKLAGRKMLPEFLYNCLEIAVGLQQLRNMESSVYKENESLDEKRISLLDEIETLREQRNKLYRNMGMAYKIPTQEINSTINMSDKIIGLEGVPIGGTHGLKSFRVGELGSVRLGFSKEFQGKMLASTATTGAMIGAGGSVIGTGGAAALGATGVFLPLAGLIATISLLSYGNQRKLKYILEGMAEAEEYFTKTLYRLKDATREPTIVALKAIQTLRNDIIGILADISEAQYMITQLKIELTFVNNTINLKKD